MRMLVPLLTFLLLVTSPTASVAGDSAGLEKLQGKWEVNKTSDDGSPYKQVIEIKKDKLEFRIVGEDGSTYLYATADVQVEQNEPFSFMKITNIKAGRSPDELEPVDDRVNIYQLDYNRLTMVSNMDKYRDNQPPVLDVYRKVS